MVAGERIQLSVELRDRLMAGRYSIECSVMASDRPGDFAVRALPIVDFLVKGSVPHAGMVFVDTDLRGLVGGSRVTARGQPIPSCATFAVHRPSAAAGTVHGICWC